jgi:hypothetical protein
MSLPESQPYRPERHDRGRPVMTDLERRYARWTALFYPADYRRTRGSELVGTYLSLTAPDRRRPSPADIADLAAGGLRQHLRTAPGLGSGFRLASLLALTTTTAFASGWVSLEALAPTVFPLRYTGPFMSPLGVAVWAVWLLTAVVHVIAPGRWFRRLAVLAVLVTVGVVPAAMLTGILRPPLSVLLPQLVLGIVAVGAAARHRWWVRLTPLAAAAVTVPVAVAAERRLDFSGNYYLPAVTVLPAVGVTLLIGALLIAFGLAVRRDYRGVWALLILLTPIGMLAVIPLGTVLDKSGPGQAVPPAWSSMVVASVLVAMIGPMLVPLALVARGRLSAGRRSSGTDRGHCPNCGAPSTSA